MVKSQVATFSGGVPPYFTIDCERKYLREKLTKFTVVFDFGIQSFTNGQPSEQPVETICLVKLGASV